MKVTINCTKLIFESLLFSPDEMEDSIALSEIFNRFPPPLICRSPSSLPQTQWEDGNKRNKRNNRERLSLSKNSSYSACFIVYLRKVYNHHGRDVNALPRSFNQLSLLIWGLFPFQDEMGAVIVLQNRCNDLPHLIWSSPFLQMPLGCERHF